MCCSLCIDRNVDGVLRIGIFARRGVSADEEITIDYNFSHFGEAVDCKCGSAACTGKIGRKRSEIKTVNGVPVTSLSAKQQQQHEELQELVPLEIERPMHVSSLVLLKTAQLETEWLTLYGFKKRRLFFSHASLAKRAKTPVESESAITDASSQAPSTASSTLSSSNSPVSAWSSPADDDSDALSTHSAPPASATPAAARPLRKSGWYARVKAGEHLPAMRALHSYICGGKSDWSSDLADIARTKQQDPAHRARAAASASQLATLRPKRLSLLEARARLFADLIAFAHGASKWNDRVASSRSLDPQRITRFIEQTQESAGYQIKHSVRLSLCRSITVDVV